MISNSPVLSPALIQLLAAYSVVLVTPGSMMLSTGTLAAMNGFARTVPFVTGIGAGTALMASLLGTAAERLTLLLPLPVFHAAGALILIIMAAKIARLPFRSEDSETGRAKSGRGLFLSGLAIALSSPLTGMFVATMFSGHLLPLRGMGIIVSVAAIVGAVNLLWYLFVAAALSNPAAQAAIRRRHSLIRRVSITALLCLAGSHAGPLFGIG